MAAALDPIVSLSVALAEAPGTCACLLGAGVSVDAGVPTAWDIQQDGLRSLYRQESGDDATVTDQLLAAWLIEQGHDHLDYSTLLAEISPDPAIRRELLAGYIKDSEPGPAHRRLADLAADGFLRVFITTNFDRLLEIALEARGIRPVIVSDDATLATAPRREHAPVFIVKVHGDYMQETIRNTHAELAELPPDLTAELRAIVDHYGLLVIGWRGSDPALAEIIRARNPSRYGTWWLSRTDPPSEPGRTLIEVAGARLIVRSGGADEFLGELQRRLDVYAAHETGDDPGSVYDQVRGAIRRREDMDLDELLRRERYVFESAIGEVRAELANSSSQETERHLAGWARMAAATDRRLASLIPLALYRPETLSVAIRQHAVWASEAPRLGGLMAFVDAWQLPFWIIGMTLGALSVHYDAYEALGPILSVTWLDPNQRANGFVGVPGELAGLVASRFGSDSPPHPQFAIWDWLPEDLQNKEWLVSRHGDWLRRTAEPGHSITNFSLLLNIATGLRDEHTMTAWWSMDLPTAERYAKRLHDEPALRAKAAAAADATLELFDAGAPEILRSMGAMGGFYSDTDRTANMLEFGAYAPPPPTQGGAGL